MSEPQTRDLDRRIRIERPVPGAANDVMRAGQRTWTLVGIVFARVEDLPAAKTEASVGAIEVSRQPARVTIRYRADVTSGMRIVIARNGEPDRVLQIVGDTSEIGRGRWLQFMVERYSTEGGGA